jgi:exosortase/archaeosortase family protein
MKEQYSLLLSALASTAVTLALYWKLAALLLSKIGEVANGVFDTSVPAYPLAGMLFLCFFLLLRADELFKSIERADVELFLRTCGLVIALLPMFMLFASGLNLEYSYSFAGVALVMSWFGVVIALRPSLFRFFTPYLIAYVIAVGAVDMITVYLGDPLAIVVAYISRVITHIFNIPVVWSFTSFSFRAAGGVPVNLYISQECSGIASISIFILLIGLMHTDTKSAKKHTLIYAAVGAILFLFLNSARVVIVALGGIEGGLAMMWSLHGWVGYALYTAGYATIASLYIRGGKQRMAESEYSQLQH